MPAVNIKDPQTYADFQAFARKHTCAESGGALIIKIEFDGQKSVYVVKCAANKEHTGFAKPSRGSIYTDPELNIYGLKLKRSVDMDGKEIAVRPTSAQVVTEEYVNQVAKYYFPGAPEIKVAELRSLAVKYNLDPARKHLHLIPFNKGKPNETWVVVFGIDATRTLARRCGNYSEIPLTKDDIPGPQALNDEQAKKKFGSSFDDNLLYVATRLRSDKGMESIGFGNYPKSQVPPGVEKGNSAFNQASIRAERQALKKLFGDNYLPEDLEKLEMVDERFVDAKDAGITITEVVNEQTGEIVEKEGQAATTTAAPAQATTVPSGATGQAQENYCTIHKVALTKFKNSKSNTYFWAHRMEDSKLCSGKIKKPSLDREQAFAKVTEYCGQIGWDEKKLNAHIKDNYTKCSNMDEMSDAQLDGLVSELQRMPPISM